MDGSEFGRYGVLRFMRRNEETVIASYPIDDDVLTFGCDPSCGVRLYYPTVSPLHAKIIFQERKAFIEVLGVHGLLVDNCQVFPASTTSHTTIPLTNNSELEISRKRFRFEYPPKALRPVLAFTPPPHVAQSARKRVLRLSMIQSAQVFTPRPDPDPHVNLRTLQTPIRLTSSPLKHVHRTPGQPQAAGPQEEEFGTPFRLVEGNCPQVVEEEQDLVILEEVDAPEPVAQATPHGMKSGAAQSEFGQPMQNPMHVPQTGGPHPAPAFPLPASQQLQQFQTPRRRPGRSSLHRAVLIRSAQRAAMRIEIEKEQEQEEREVEEHVIPNEDQMEVCEEDQDAVIEEIDEDVHGDGYGENEVPGLEPAAPVFGLRQGIEAFKSGLQALRSRSRSPEKNEHMERGAGEAHTISDEDAAHYTFHDDGEPYDQDQELQEPEEEEGLGDVTFRHGARHESEIGVRAASVPRQFTPQRPERHLLFMTPQVSKANGNLSLADRVRGRKSTGCVGQASLGRSWRVPEVKVPDADQSTLGSPGQRRVSDSERQAIKERRRSALAQPDMFFGGNVPGSRRNSLGSDTPGAKAASIFVSPSKTWDPIKEDEEEAETDTLLEKMKEVVEGMQRRRSVQPEVIADVAVSNTSEGDKDAGQQDEKHKVDEVTAEEPVPLQPDFRSTAQSFPATPRMSDLKHVFSEKRAVNIPPSYAGVRDLFKAEPAMNPETPRLDGVREMSFRARDREQSTPIFEGVGEVLAIPAEHPSQETTHGDEIEMECTTEADAPAPSSKRPRGKPTVADLPARPGSRIAGKMPAVRPRRDARPIPSDVEQFADDELVPDAPPAKHLKPNAKSQKGSNVRRTRAENDGKQDTATALTKPATKARKVVTPEVPEHVPPKPNPVAPEPGPARRSRTATKSTGSTTTESEAAEPSKSTRKTARGTKAAAPPAAGPEPDATPDQEAEPMKAPRRGGRTRSQSVEVAPAPAPATTKRRVGAKSKKTADASATQEAPAEDGPSRRAADRAESPEAPAPTARARRGKTKSTTETEDEGTGALRVARGRRTPTTAAAAASNRAPAGKGRAIAVAVVIPYSGKSTARAVAGEKENTPERVHVKEEEDDKVTLPPVAAKGTRGRKAAAGALKAQSEPEKDATVAKTRAPRTRAASGRK